MSIDHLLTAGACAALAIACASGSPAQPAPSAPHHHAEHAHAEHAHAEHGEPAATAPGVAGPSDAGVQAGHDGHDPGAASPPPSDPAALEVAAFERAKPVFVKHCAACHTTGGATSSKKALGHLAMDAYPFGGHHANEITAALRKALGARGPAATMPKSRPGAVKGDELRAILDWANAYDVTHPPGHDAPDGRAHDGAGHEH